MLCISEINNVRHFETDEGSVHIYRSGGWWHDDEFLSAGGRVRTHSRVPGRILAGHAPAAAAATDPAAATLAAHQPAGQPRSGEPHADQLNAARLVYSFSFHF